MYIKLRHLKMLVLFVFIILLASCSSSQDRASKKLQKKIDIFNHTNQSRLDFLSYISPNNPSFVSYVIDTRVFVEKIVFPNIVIVSVNNTKIAIEFLAKEQNYLRQVEEGAWLVLQEGILKYNGVYKYEDRNISKFILCRNKACRNMAVDTMIYMNKFADKDPRIPPEYDYNSLYKFIVNYKKLGIKPLDN